MWAVLKQLLSTNWLNKSAVKGEVSLVSCRNFWFLSCEDKRELHGACFAKFELSVVEWHERGHFVCLSSLCFDVKQGISLTTWMVVGETDKWKYQFQNCHFFLLFTMLSGNWLKRYFAVLTWANNSVCIDCCFFLAFVFVTKIYICPKDLLLFVHH